MNKKILLKEIQSKGKHERPKSFKKVDERREKILTKEEILKIKQPSWKLKEKISKTFSYIPASQSLPTEEKISLLRTKKEESEEAVKLPKGEKKEYLTIEDVKEEIERRKSEKKLYSYQKYLPLKKEKMKELLLTSPPSTIIKNLKDLQHVKQTIKKKINKIEASIPKIPSNPQLEILKKERTSTKASLRKIESKKPKESGFLNFGEKQKKMNELKATIKEIEDQIEKNEDLIPKPPSSLKTWKGPNHLQKIESTIDFIKQVLQSREYKDLQKDSNPESNKKIILERIDKLPFLSGSYTPEEEIVHDIVVNFSESVSAASLRKYYYEVKASGKVPNLTDAKVSEIINDMILQGLLSETKVHDPTRVITEFIRDPKDYNISPKEKAKKDIKYLFEKNLYKSGLEGQKYIHIIGLEKEADEEIFKDAIHEFHRENLPPNIVDSNVLLLVGRGYNSNSQLRDLRNRLKKYPDKKVVLTYFGDFDPDGLKIQEILEKKIVEKGIKLHKVNRALVRKDQISELKLKTLPPNFQSKHIVDFVEKGNETTSGLDAVPMEIMKDSIKDYIDLYYDQEKTIKLQEQAERKTEKYRQEIVNQIMEMKVNNFKEKK